MLHPKKQKYVTLKLAHTQFLIGKSQKETHMRKLHEVTALNNNRVSRYSARQNRTPMNKF